MKCRYHARGFDSGYPVKIKDEDGKEKTAYVYCNYACTTGISTLTLDSDKNVIDRRGIEYNNCLLFEEGEPEKKVHNIHVGRGEYYAH